MTVVAQISNLVVAVAGGHVVHGICCVEVLYKVVGFLSTVVIPVDHELIHDSYGSE